MHNKNLTFSFFALVLILVLSGCSQNQTTELELVEIKPKNEIIEEVVEEVAQDQESAITYNEDGSVDASDWVEYVNEEYGFKLRHPESFVLKSDGESFYFDHNIKYYPVDSEFTLHFFDDEIAFMKSFQFDSYNKDFLNVDDLVAHPEVNQVLNKTFLGYDAKEIVIAGHGLSIGYLIRLDDRGVCFIQFDGDDYGNVRDIYKLIGDSIRF